MAKVRHAAADSLNELEPLLSRLRRVDGLVERSRGVFYRRSKAFLHFHEDPSGLHADVRLGADFERFRVTSAAEQEALLDAVARCLDLAPGPHPPRTKAEHCSTT